MRKQQSALRAERAAARLEAEANAELVEGEGGEGGTFEKGKRVRELLESLQSLPPPPKGETADDVEARNGQLRLERAVAELRPLMRTIGVRLCRSPPPSVPHACPRMLGVWPPGATAELRGQ